MVFDSMSISGYSVGFALVNLHLATKKLQTAPQSPVEGDENLTFSVYDANSSTVFAIHEVDQHPETNGSDGALSAWQWKPEESSLTRQQIVSSQGQGPAHVAQNPTNGQLWVSNYGAGTLAVYSTRQGQIKDLLLHVKVPQGSQVNSDRQMAAHIHGAFFFREFAYVVDLGSDAIYTYRMTGPDAVQEVDRVGYSSQPGSGPRHLAIDEAHERAYLLNELKNTVEVLSINTTSGGLSRLAIVNYQIPNATQGVQQYGAGIHVHPNGKFLYLSNRGDGAIVVYSIQPAAKNYLKLEQTFKTQGTWPRSFTITQDGHFMLVPDQFLDVIELLSVDPASGQLSLLDSMPTIKAPAIVTQLN
ncbi:hypothetical protein TCAL_17422 [Tigriopus californicus]|uniref:6-phosphogluconolactonase n=1 Tax=Tigriopus californicus TaxID=6832 RepID=A0A553NBK9_TIGCA|nr:hypothetical protein TCAL_17422 [Tigriopus californicus]